MSTDRHAVSGTLLALLAIPLLLSGCAAVRAGIQVNDAQAARDAAIEEGAEKTAIYEFTMAERYLQKAWEEMGTGAYKTSVQLSRKSAEWSDQAIVQTKQGNRGIDVSLEGLRDVTPPPPDEPAPETPVQEPTVETPAPDEPASETPAPDEPAPDEPAPDEPTPDEPAPDVPVEPAP